MFFTDSGFYYNVGFFIFTKLDLGRVRVRLYSKYLVGDFNAHPLD